MQSKLTSKSYSYLYLLSAGITSMCHHTSLLLVSHPCPSLSDVAVPSSQLDGIFRMSRQVLSNTLTSLQISAMVFVVSLPSEAIVLVPVSIIYVLSDPSWKGTFEVTGLIKVNLF